MSYFFSCKFGGHYKNCSQLFQSIITDSGHCCAFNILPEQILMNRNENIETYWFGVLSQWLNWNPESGYAFPYNSNDLPRRSISPGLFSGLSVTLNLNRTQHFCTSTSAIGLRVIIKFNSLRSWILPDFLGFITSAFKWSRNERIWIHFSSRIWKLCGIRPSNVDLWWSNSWYWAWTKGLFYCKRKTIEVFPTLLIH